QQKIDLVARMGGNWYCRAHGDALFEIAKPLTTSGIGVDSLPDHIRLSKRLSGNHLGMLGNLESFPEPEFIESIKSKYSSEQRDAESIAIELLESGKNNEALALLMG